MCYVVLEEWSLCTISVEWFCDTEGWRFIVDRSVVMQFLVRVMPLSVNHLVFCVFASKAYICKLSFWTWKFCVMTVVVSDCCLSCYLWSVIFVLWQWNEFSIFVFSRPLWSNLPFVHLIIYLFIHFIIQTCYTPNFVKECISFIQSYFCHNLGCVGFWKKMDKMINSFNHSLVNSFICFFKHVFIHLFFHSFRMRLWHAGTRWTELLVL